MSSVRKFPQSLPVPRDPCLSELAGSLTGEGQRRPPRLEKALTPSFPLFLLGMLFLQPPQVREQACTSPPLPSPVAGQGTHSLADGVWRKDSEVAQSAHRWPLCWLTAATEE